MPEAIPESFLLSYIYQYVVEALIFGLGIYCGVKTGVLAPSSGQGLRRLCWLCGGFLFVMALQGAFLLYGK